MLKRSWLQALMATVCVLALTGCGDECVNPSDCNEKGAPPAGKEYACIENTCELRDKGPDGATCSPECAGGEFCDTSSGQGVCRTCNATQGCTAPQFCDEAADNGKGVCVACTDTGSGTDQGCADTAPVCDTAAGNGVGVCKACVDSAQGTDQDLGCSASRPMCDAAAANGVGVCKACMDSAQGTDLDLGCSAANPICSPTASNGAGACRTCLDSAQGTDLDMGCSETAPLCNATASGGRGVCKACLDSLPGAGTDQGCADTAPFCDATVGTVGMCKTCLDSVAGNATDQGCGDTAPFCDTGVGNGAGMCKACLDSEQGATTDLGCADAAPLCDSTGACKVCMDSAPAAGTDVGCGVTIPICDTAASNGAGMCKVCQDTEAPGSATADQGCYSPTSLCDTAGANGVGACRVCMTSNNEGCPAALSCNVDGTGCENCMDNTSCTIPSTPVCYTTPTPPVCVECTDNTHCSATRPACDLTTNLCGCETDTECAAQGGDTDFCDLTANNGRGGCKVCVTDANCAGADPTKPYCDNQTACIQCRVNADCALTHVCNASNACELVPGADPATTSGQIQAFIALPVGAIAPPLTIENVFVTYIKPEIGSPASGDVAGFFLQAQHNGPAMFVEADPSTLQVGDRITLSIGEKIEYTSKVRAAKSISGLTIVSRGHPVQNVNTDARPGLAVDVSAATDLVSGVEGYFGKILRLTGTMSDTFVGGAGTGHSAIDITTAGIKAAPLPRLRVPTALMTQYELGPNCTFTLDVGPMWKFTSGGTTPTTTAQPSAYSREDFSALVCPPPKLVAVSAPTNTTVRVTFDGTIDPASITDPGTQFTFTPGDLTATAAVVSGKEITLTTTPQPGGVTYSISVAGSVKDVAGRGVETPNSASFTTFLAVKGAQLGISGTGFTGATEVTIGGVAQPFTVNSDTQLTITGVTETTPLGSQPLVVTTTGGPVTIGNTRVIELVINELDPDQAGTDMAEFVEISTGAPNLVLSGFVLVFYNGSNDTSYLTLDLYATTDANGFIVAANPGVTPRVLTFPNNTLQNGVDAIAIYQGSSAAFPNGTPVTATGLIDAVVHETADPDDAGLLDVLLYPAGDPRRVQADENPANNGQTVSIQRCGPGLRDGRVYSVAAPTPSAANTCP
ncbi:MAG: Ig-like domain-containing protein [Myxococcaceae bacterium]|nr:Ig-like domain-containing protein [Myxococcaceae bacterium]